MTTFTEPAVGSPYARIDALDEAVQADGSPRANWADLLEALLDDLTHGEEVIAAHDLRRPVLP